jgi:hypothetical protein
MLSAYNLPYSYTRINCFIKPRVVESLYVGQF